MNLPEKYIQRMKDMLGEEYDDYIKSFDENKYCGIRANTLKVSPERLCELVDWELTPVKWCDTGFYYNEEIRPAKHPFYNAGLYYIQEPSAMSTGAMLNVEPGDRVLDLCAAPGGKSTQVAAKLQGEGVIVSNDISASRCKALLKNIEVCGVKNAVITNETPEKLAAKFEGYFNKIIVDAPCSGEGMFRKDDNAVRSWEEHKSEMCCELQRDILKNAAKMLTEGGVIAYSTCTFAPSEDEGMIWEFLSAHPEFELLEVDKAKGFADGHPEWTEGGSEELKKCGRLWPHKIQGEGHFLCLIRKKGSSVRLTPMPHKNPSEKELVDFYSFCDQFLNIKIDKPLIIHGSSLMALPENLPNLKGLRIMRSGLYIGELKKNRFEPSQAFAMTLKKEEARLTLDFDLGSEELVKYLRGDSFPVDCNDGWALVCVKGYPLGWGKVQGGRLKNKYLPSWMM